MGHSGFLKVTNNYAETTRLIDYKNTLKESSYTPQQDSRRVQLSKLCVNLWL